MSIKSIKNFIEDIESSGFKIYPFACTRAPYAYINSALQQTIKNGKFHAIIKLGSDNKIHSDLEARLPNTLALIKKSEKFFGQSMSYYPFNVAIQYSGGPVAFLIEQVLRIPFKTFEPKISNQSLCNTTTRLINCLNSSNANKESLNLRRIRKSIDQHANNDKFLMTEEEFESIKPQFETIKEIMQKTLGVSHVDETIKFSKPLTELEINEVLKHCSQSLRDRIMTTEQYQALN
jgi:hypothetical protein